MSFFIFSKIADDVRVAVSLVDAKTGNKIWGDSFDGNYTEKLLIFQSTAAIQIASSLNAVITPNEERRIDKLPTSEITAYDFYVNGKYELGFQRKAYIVRAIKIHAHSHQFLRRLN